MTTVDPVEVAECHVFADIDMCAGKLSAIQKYINVYDFKYSDRLLATPVVGKSLHSFLKDYMHIFGVYAESLGMGLYLYFLQINCSDTVYRLVLSNDKFAPIIHPDQIEMVSGFMSRKELNDDRIAKINAWQSEQFSYEYVTRLTAVHVTCDLSKLEPALCIRVSFDGNSYSIRINGIEFSQSPDKIDVSNKNIFKLVKETIGIDILTNEQYYNCWNNNINKYKVYNIGNGNQHIIIDDTQIIMSSNSHHAKTQKNFYYYEFKFY